MRILVTGRGGQLVRSLVERAAGRKGLTIVPVGRPELDLEMPDAVEAAIRSAAPDLVINAAAYTEVDKAEDEPERAMIVNAQGAGAVAAGARAAGAPVIQISTDYVFDGASAVPYREDAPVDPLGAYGRSKLAGEQAVRAAAPDHAIVRTAWVYSPFGRNFVRTMMAAAAARDTLSVVADQRGNPTSALDLADGLLAMIDNWRTGGRTGLGETYHLAGTGEASWAGFAEAIFAECEGIGAPFARVVPIGTADWPTRAPRPANSTLDCAKFARDFGFRMPDWRASLGPVVAPIREQGPGPRE